MTFIEQKLAELASHPQPTFAEGDSWWMRNRDGAIQPYITRGVIRNIQEQIQADILYTELNTTSDAVVKWCTWESEVIDIIDKAKKQSIMPLNQKTWTNAENYTRTQVGYYGRLGNILLIQQKVTTTHSNWQWSSKHLRYYIVDIDSGTCVNVPSPKRYIKKYPGMGDVVRHMVKIASKKLIATVTKIGA